MEEEFKRERPLGRGCLQAWLIRERIHRNDQATSVWLFDVLAQILDSITGRKKSSAGNPAGDFFIEKSSLNLLRILNQVNVLTIFKKYQYLL